MAKELDSVRELREKLKKQEVADFMIDKLCDELDVYEKVLWIGRSIPEDAPRISGGIINHGPLFKKIGFGILIGAVVIGLLLMLSSVATGIGIMIFLGVLGGIALAVSWAAGLAKHKIENERDTRPCYIVTSRRVLMHCGTWYQDGGAFQVWLPEQLHDMYRVDSHLVEGAGDIIFKKEVTRDRIQKQTNMSVCGMFCIGNVMKVESLMRKYLLKEKD